MIVGLVWFPVSTVRVLANISLPLGFFCHNL
jgi:hypothetical protein